MNNVELRKDCIKDGEKCAEIVNNWISKTKWMLCLYTKTELSKMIKEAIPLIDFWVIGDPDCGLV